MLYNLCTGLSWKRSWCQWDINRMRSVEVNTNWGDSGSCDVIVFRDLCFFLDNIWIHFAPAVSLLLLVSYSESLEQHLFELYLVWHFINIFSLTWVFQSVPLCAYERIPLYFCGALQESSPGYHSEPFSGWQMRPWLDPLWQAQLQELEKIGISNQVWSEFDDDDDATLYI